MAKSKSPAPTSTRLTPSELRYHAQVHRNDQIGRSFRALVYCAAGAFGGYCVYLSVKELSGKSTDFRAVIDWAAKADVSEWAARAIAAIFFGGWLFERRRNGKLVNQVGRASELEAARDAGRTSSGLTRDGATPREEEL